jgi:hypothetical protein
MVFLSLYMSYSAVVLAVYDSFSVHGHSCVRAVLAIVQLALYKYLPSFMYTTVNETAP